MSNSPSHSEKNKFKELLTKIFNYIKTHKLQFGVGAGGIVLCVVIALILFLPKHNNNIPPENTEETTIAAETTTQQSKAELSGVANPLTGLPLKNDDAKTARPIAVMHNNVKPAMPLLGISNADVIYEMSVEGGLTRIMAIYQEYADIPLLGSVRSARVNYLEAALAHDAVLVHCGQSHSDYSLYSNAYKAFNDWKVDHINAENLPEKYFWRDQARRSQGYSLEHTMVTDGAKITELMTESQFPKTHDPNSYVYEQKFQENYDNAGTPHKETVTVNVTSGKKTTFDYDDTTKLYTVGQYSEPMKDGAVKDAVLQVSNVIVMKTSVKTLPDKDGHIQIDLQSGGSGYLISGGKCVPILWSRNGLRAPFVYKNEAGNVIPLSTGKSYVCVCFQNGAVGGL